MSDGIRVVVKAGSAGGSVKLLGRWTEAGEWRFALATVDHTAELVREQDLERVEVPALHWVDSWEKGLRLFDRYPWVQLYPREVHPLFVEDVRSAVAERLVGLPPGPRRERQQREWERVLKAAGGAAG